MNKEPIPPPQIPEGGEGLVERVARAIYLACLRPAERQRRSVARTDQEYEDMGWREYEDAAKAAISILLPKTGEGR